MKKHGLRKIIASVSLSLVMALTAGLAYASVDNGYVNASTTVTASGFASNVVASEGDSASFVENEAQLNLPTSTFTGLKLTGKTGATFDLGSVNIADSNWAGNYNASAPSTDANKNNSLIELVFAPHDNNYYTESATDSGQGEITSVDLFFTQGASTMSLRITYYSYGIGGSNEYLAGAKAGTQGNYAAYRSNKTSIINNGIRKSNLSETDATNLGLATFGDGVFGTRGASKLAIPFYYDFADAAIYTPGAFPAGGLTDSYLIRDFNSTDPKCNGADGIWEGFKKDANGKAMVNVTVKFNTVRDDDFTSVIITKLGNHQITSNIELGENDFAVKEVANEDVSLVLGQSATINVPTLKGCGFAGYSPVATQSVIISNNGSVVKTYNSADIVDGKVEFTPEFDGFYDVKVIADDYVQEFEIAALAAAYSTTPNAIAESLVVSEGATATYGSATTHSGEYKGIVLTGGKNATFTYKNVDISGMKYSEFDTLVDIMVTPKTTSVAYAIIFDINGDGVRDLQDLDINKDGSFTDADLDVDADGILDYKELADNADGSTIAYTGENAAEVIANVVKTKPVKNANMFYHGMPFNARELDSLHVTVTDVNNPELFFTVSYTSAEYNEDKPDVQATSGIVAFANGQTAKAWRALQGGNPKGYTNNCPSDVSFTGSKTNGFKLYYDAEQKALYKDSAVVHSATGDSRLIRDLDDPAAEAALFEGFSGNVDIKIEFGTLSTNGAGIKFHDTYTGVPGSVYYNAFVGEQGELPSTSVVLTNLLGMDLTKDVIVHEYNESKLVTDAKLVSVDIGKDIELPAIVKKHPLIGELDFSATYQVLNSENEVVKSGDYVVGEKFALNEIGAYKLVVTDTLRQQIIIPIKVNALLYFDAANTIDFADYISGKKYSVTDDINVKFDIEEGYELLSATLNGAEIAVVDGSVNIPLSSLTGNDTLRIRTKPIVYKVTYKMQEDDTYSVVKNFTKDDILDGVALINPEEVSGKKFLGWFINENKFESYADVGLQNIVVYGVYGNANYNVTFVDGTSKTVQMVEVGQKAIYYNVEKEGYVLLGWYDANGNKFSFDTVITGDVTLTAKWQANSSASVGNVGEADAIIDAEIKEYEEGVNALQVVFIVIFGLGVASAVAFGVLFLLKKLGKI